MDALYEGTSRGILVLEAGVAIAANAAAASLLGTEAACLIGQTWAAVCRPTRADGAALPDEEDPIAQATRTRRPSRSGTLAFQGPGGARLLVEIEAIPVLDAAGMPAQVVCIIEERRAQAGDAMLYDPLTGLASDALFRDRLDHGLASAQRAHWPLALLLAGFEDGAPAQGRTADRLFPELSRRLRQTLRDSDTVGRLGDDRFGMLLPATDPAGAVNAARRLLSALGQPYQLDGDRIDGSGSIGIAIYPDHGKDTEALLSAAEAARLVALRNGRGYALYAAEEERFRPPHLALAADLRQALGRRELLLEYLPVVALQDDTLWGLEVLLRWQHPRRGVLAADEFVPVAEQIGLVDALTWWTLETALRQRQGWPSQGRQLRLAMPLALHTLYDPGLPTSIRQLLHEYDFPPRMLSLEVAGQPLAAQGMRMAAMLSRLAESGVGLTLSTGDGSAVALGRLPLQAVKIERSLVHRLQEGGAAGETVRALIAQYHARDLRVVVEEVEDRQTWDTLRHLCCDRAQGPYVSGPLGAADLEGWLASSPWGIPCP